MKSGTLEETQKPETMTPLQALILEDSKNDVELLLLYLRRTGFNVTHSVAENMKQRSEEHTSELQSHLNLVCRLLLEKKKTRPSGTVQQRRLTAMWIILLHPCLPRLRSCHRLHARGYRLNAAVLRSGTSQCH